MAKSALIIVFNHRFEQNLKKIRRLYSDRFSEIRFLMPFPREEHTDVIPVYESSAKFHSFFSQAWPSIESIDCEYYALTGDDFILNPNLNESNLHDVLSLNDDTSYISDILPVTRASAKWWRLRTVLKDLKYAGDCFKWSDELPQLNEAITKFAKLGLPTDDLRWSPSHGASGLLPLGRGLKNLLKTRLLIAYLGAEMAYPLAWGYSDFIVVPKAIMPDYVRYCRVLAAMGIFVESAAPTALALSSPKINTESSIGLRSTIAWDIEQVVLAKSVGKTLHSLLSSFKPTEIGKHPVKLSTFQDF